MSYYLLLDAGPLGLVTNPKAIGEPFRAAQWLYTQQQQARKILLPEITDYEVRRELVRAGKSRGIARLNQFKIDLGYLPLTTTAMLLAADLWAESRRQGRPNAPDQALDADVILAAQALLIQNAGHQVTVATTNVKHLELFVDARLWSDIA
ncbi:MAG: nucleic acid-binding protein [Acidobacteria bacterium]|nr:nucleic acid-binding protein [Acidobacteriota bacterium]MBI3426837.1 nucleic acid-binding protein [Acidobacteriota bacterium]